jgi:hypothetical protein
MTASTVDTVEPSGSLPVQLPPAAQERGHQVDQTKPLDLESTLIEAGEFGRYQALLLVMVMIITAYGYSLALAFSFVAYSQHSR